MNRLIYDRTSANVQQAKNNQSDASFLKGAYNYTDLNRIEEWCVFLASELTNAGYPISLTTKTNWSINDFPTQAELTRIRNNVASLKNIYYASTSVPSSISKMTYQKANAIEKVLQELYNNWLGASNWYVYSGVSNAGQPRLWQHRFREFIDPVSISDFVATETDNVITTESGEELEVVII